MDKEIENEIKEEAKEEAKEEVVKDEEDDSIRIKKDELDNIKKTLKKLADDNKMLLAVADKKGTSLYYQRHKEKLPSDVKIRKIDGKVIIAWKTIDDEVYQDSATGRWIEKQNIQLLFEDGSTKDINLRDFNRRYTHTVCKQVGVKEEDGRITLKLEEPDTGKIYNIGVEYVN